MVTYTLKRTLFDPQGTIGVLMDSDGAKVCLTCELPWQNNAQGISCIPKGIYRCQRYDSLAHVHVWELLNVPGRTSILIHNGNTENDSKGCIVVGDKVGNIHGMPAVLNSVKTLDMLRHTFPDVFTLIIT